jgi:hypothetical protein
MNRSSTPGPARSGVESRVVVTRAAMSTISAAGRLAGGAAVPGLAARAAACVSNALRPAAFAALASSRPPDGEACPSGESPLSGAARFSDEAAISRVVADRVPLLPSAVAFSRPPAAEPRSPDSFGCLPSHCTSPFSMS